VAAGAARGLQAGDRRFDPDWLHLRFTCKSDFYAVHDAFRKPAAQGWASRLGIKRLSAWLFPESPAVRQRSGSRVGPSSGP
jgi:hypothetical protein